MSFRCEVSVQFTLREITDYFFPNMFVLILSVVRVSIQGKHLHLINTCVIQNIGMHYNSDRMPSRKPYISFLFLRL